MDIRVLSQRYAVSPQISVEDAGSIADAGFSTVICNRPDSEVPASHQAETIRQAVEAAGLSFELLEMTHQTMTPQNIARQMEMVAAAPGPVLAYCASGTRCSVIWALGMAGEMAVDDILTATAKAGYQLDNLRPTLEVAAGQSG